MKTVANRREVEIDTKIAETYSRWRITCAGVARATKTLRLIEKRKVSVPSSTYEKAEASLAVAKFNERTAYAEYKEADNEYGGWSRFFLVPMGHIHSSTSCSTCYVTTAFSWLPELSGLTEKDAVSEYGEILCSVCFPSAPVEWTNGVNRKEAEAKALAAALKEISRSAEGKKVESARKLVSRKTYRLEHLNERLTRLAEWALGSPPAYVVEEASEAPKLIAKTERELARAEAKLAAALEALDAALASG